MKPLNWSNLFRTDSTFSTKKAKTLHRVPGRHGRQKETVAKRVRGLAGAFGGKRESASWARRAVSLLLGRTESAAFRVRENYNWGNACQRTNQNANQNGRCCVQKHAGRQRKNFPAAAGAFRKVFRIGTAASGADPSMADSGFPECQVPVVQLLTLLLMAIFTKALFAFVRRNFVTFTFFSARHIAAKL